jgi:hypothetical protein
MTSLPNASKNCDNLTVFNKKCNEITLQNETDEWAQRSVVINAKNNLYPNLNDPDFNVKIALKKEFNDAKYDGPIMDVEEYSNILNNSKSFELQPHQLFVKNFLSSQTPYNSLLLYHGLGSGKTCSAIGICEEHRDYGSKQKIIVIASPNVQDNFRLQLFDKRKLKRENGGWKMDACTGDKFLREINATVAGKNIDEDVIDNQIKDVINTYYDFMGYTQFANTVNTIINNSLKFVLQTASEEVKRQHVASALKREFSGRLIVIDEVHNLRIAEDNPKKDTSINLMSVVRASSNVRLLLLSATPMYNNYTEIIWLINLMNANDRRGEIKIEDVFNKNDWKKDGTGREIGKELFIRKCTGYISFVRGENPYTFPFRIYPNMFVKNVSMPFYTFNGVNDNGIVIPYPGFQMNGLPVPQDPLSTVKNTIKLTLSHIGNYQMLAYKCIMHNVKNSPIFNSEKSKAIFEEMESFGYTLLQKPLEALNMVFPVDGLISRANMVPPLKKNAFIDNGENVNANAMIGKFSDEGEGELGEEGEGGEEDIVLTSLAGGAPATGVTKKKKKVVVEEPVDPSSFNLSNLIGKSGLKHSMNYEDTEKAFDNGTFEYKHDIVKNSKRGRFFAQNKIGKYSSKISKICNCIYNPETQVLSNGIILIYSQYMYSGLIPMALALEEMGFTRYGSNIHSTLFKTPPREPLLIDVLSPSGDVLKRVPARYTMITGDKRLSKNNDAAVKDLTEDSNAYGYDIKIVLISKAGSEGLDFKAIRQIHVIDPWYNMNRIEQIIGRGVRNFGHKQLPFKQRNVEIFLHATLLIDKNDDELGDEFQREDDKESADLYVYRVAEKKAIQIGMVSRVLKENAVDCIVNHEQTNFVQANFLEPVKQELSIFGEIDYQVGDAPFSSACDYMKKCDFNYDTQYTTNPKLNASKIESLHALQNINASAKDDDPDYEAKLNGIVNDETYVSKFSTTNMSKIMQKIKEAFKMHFFYKKTTLFLAINAPKSFPTVQIYASLNAFINNKQEYIMDKYGRSGNLTNVGEYYMFKPIELSSNMDLSLFDKITPIDFKHRTIKFNLQDRLEIMPRAKKQYDLLGIDEEEEGEAFVERVGEAKEDIESRNRRTTSVANKIIKLYQCAMDAYNSYTELMDKSGALSLQHVKKMTKIIIKTSEEDNWYGHFGVTMYKLLKNDATKMVGITLVDLNMYLIHHIVDLLNHSDKLSLLNYLYTRKDDELDDFEKHAKDYSGGVLVHKYKQKTYAILFNGKTKIDYETGEDTNRKIYILKPNGFEPIDLSDEKRIIEYIATVVNGFKDFNVKGKINSLIGFIGYEKLGEHLLFKIKDINNLRNLAGARCDQFSKSSAIIDLNKLLSGDVFTNENTSGATEELCIMIELICRHFSASRKNGKIWFLTLEQAELYNIEHCKMNNSKFDCTNNK